MKYARYIIIIALASLLLWGVYWAKGKAEEEVCQKVDIQIENFDSTSFVNAEGVLQYLTQNHMRLQGVPMKDINLQAVEQLLAKSPYLEYGECVKALNGVLIIKVKQLVPVMRVMDGDNVYYVNRDGKQMPASTSFSADVMIVKGHFSAKYPPERLVPLIEYVQADSVLNSLVAMIEYRDSNNIYIVPNIIGHVVNMGDASGYENKFKKLLLFYKKVMPEMGWDTYDTISVKWNHQVVGNLRHRRVHVQQVDTVDRDNNEYTTPITNADNPPETTEPAKTKPPEKPKEEAKAKAKPKEKDKPKPKEKEKPKATDKNKKKK